MGKFLFNFFFKNPIGFIVLGVLFTLIIGPMGIEGENYIGFIVGPIIVVIGIIWLLKKRNKNQIGLASHMPLYNALVSELKKNEYELDEYEKRNDRIRSNIKKNGNIIGDLFIVAPPPSESYKLLKDLIDKTENRFKHDYCKEFDKMPDKPISYWHNESLVGAYMYEPMKNYSEIKFLAIIAEFVEELAASLKDK